MGSISDDSYFNEEIKPNIDDSIKQIEKPHSLKEKNQFYANGKVSLLPIMWEEPFGFVFIESMASGTPIIAFARGSVPEIIQDGKTGFIVNPSDDDIRGDWIIKNTGIRGLCEAVEKIYSLSNEEYIQMRKTCRSHVEKYFTIERMVDEYEKLYIQLINKQTGNSRFT